jgi:hypothetical protein
MTLEPESILSAVLPKSVKLARAVAVSFQKPSEW